MDTTPAQPSTLDTKPLAPETREEMFRAYQRIAESGLTNSSDRASNGTPAIFHPNEKGDLLAKLNSCSDDVFIETTRAFLDECGHARRGTWGMRLVHAQCFMDDLREGLRDVDDPVDTDLLNSQVQGYQQLLDSYREKMPDFGMPLEEADEKNLRQFAKKILEITLHLTKMNFYTENRGQGELLVALLYKIRKLLDIPQTFAFAQMSLEVLLSLTEEFTLVEDRYKFKLATFVDSYVATLQTRLSVRAEAVRILPE